MDCRYEDAYERPWTVAMGGPDNSWAEPGLGSNPLNYTLAFCDIIGEQSQVLDDYGEAEADGGTCSRDRDVFFGCEGHNNSNEVARVKELGYAVSHAPAQGRDKLGSCRSRRQYGA